MVYLKKFLSHIFFSFPNSQNIIIIYLLIYYIIFSLLILGLTPTLSASRHSTKHCTTVNSA
jgi:hypothetical protein